MKKKRGRNPKGVMPPALKRYWREHRRKNPKRVRKKGAKRKPNLRIVRRINPLPTQHIILAQKGRGKVMKFTGSKFSDKGHAARFVDKAAGTKVLDALRAAHPVLKGYRTWVT
jgi:hypothetical protein